MKIYVKASHSLAESIAHQNNIPKYILQNDSVNLVLEILQRCAAKVPNIDSRLEMFYRRSGQPSVIGENVTIRLCPDVNSIPGGGWGDSAWVAEFHKQADELTHALGDDQAIIKSLPGVLEISTFNHEGPYVTLKIER